jgi:hypothetical protein
MLLVIVANINCKLIINLMPKINSLYHQTQQFIKNVKNSFISNLTFIQQTKC